MKDECELSSVIRAAAKGNYDSLAEVYEAYRERLRRMIQFRLDPRLKGRVDESDVLQDTYLDVQRRLPEYDRHQMPFFLWLRLVTGQRLTDIHRYHLGAKKRSVSRELPKSRRAIPSVSSASLGAQIVDSMHSPRSIVLQRDAYERVIALIESMTEVDREILTLRHFEQLDNSEAAIELGISINAASNRYVRALQRLRTLFDPKENHE